MKNHLTFLRVVFLHTITAFGGPQSQLGLLIKSMSERNKFFTSSEILDVNVFCQMLPGATATQTITLLGYKKGGILLGFFTLLIWTTPAVLLMSVFSFLTSSQFGQFSVLLRFIQPMALGFLCFGSFKTIGLINNFVSRLVFVISCSFVFLFFQSPWVFPLVIILGAFLGFFLNHKESSNHVHSLLPLRIFPIILFIFLFISAAFLSENARKHNWQHRTPFNLFENMYRFGSYVFGGADVLIPVMYNQYVIRPEKAYIKKFNKEVISINRQDFLNATGVVRAIPGPAFSIAAFIGGVSMSGHSTLYQITGCIIGAVSIFLPSFLLGIFFFPLWEQLKNIASLRRSLSGVNAAVIGIMIAGALYLFRDSFMLMRVRELNEVLSYLFVFSVTLLLLFFTRVSAPFIVLGVLFLGLSQIF
jgi:chromate transporter